MWYNRKHKLGGSLHIQRNAKKEFVMKHTINRSLIATAAVAAGAFCLHARTVAWYHFNEGANGMTPTGGQPVIMNAAEPTSLSGYPYALTGTRTTGTTGNLPVFTNDMPSCVSWFDPVTGVRGGDNRSIFLKTNDRKSSYPASTILIDDDAQLHCQRITVELMLKSSPEAAAKHAYGDWLHVLNMLTSSSGNSKSWGIMIRGSGQLIGIINTAENDFNGSSTSGDAGGGGAAGYLYSTVVSGNVPKITDGKWHHVAMTYDGAMVRLYVDYVLRGYLAWSGTLAYDSGNTGKLCIGANYGTSYGAWDGFIDEVRISDEALPPEKFLQIGGLTNHASDPDTAIYLPFNALDFSTDEFFGTVGQAIFHNSACSTNAALINLSLSTIGAGVYPRLDTGASAVVSNELHAGIFAANAIDNTGCWTTTIQRTTTNILFRLEISRLSFISGFPRRQRVHPTSLSKTQVPRERERFRYTCPVLGFIAALPRKAPLTNTRMAKRPKSQRGMTLMYQSPTLSAAHGIMSLLLSIVRVRRLLST